ncbi:hypothetical protein HAX54_014143 [Datura stramonium]|uniref:Uncharacterized protein n=1 Tax=Datura stramonium TaxID=4076 RepID=A0ABS8TMK9_DATST|nr:hypothetical protein [Datura stramonium]
MVLVSWITTLSLYSYGAFATGGCDGYVNVCDGNNSYQHPKYPSNLEHCRFAEMVHSWLSKLASSYTFEEGKKPVNEVKVKPKPKVLPSPDPRSSILDLSSGELVIIYSKQKKTLATSYASLNSRTPFSGLEIPVEIL